MTSAIAVLVVLAAVFAASVLVERVLGRSRKEFLRPGWYYVLFGVFVPAIVVVYWCVSIDSPFLYAAYALSGGIAALVAQCFYGIKLPGNA